MLEIDGSAGGGQILRSSLALATLTGRAVRVENVRGARDQPGLKRQHATAVLAAARVAGAETEGVAVGSETVAFEPGGGVGGRHAVDVGTAGSLTLLFETVLPTALAADGPIRLRATGGTDVAWSPPFDYLRRVKLPLLCRNGLVASAELERRGFYPTGGGAATLTLAPSSLDRIALGEPVTADDIRGVRVYAAAGDELAEPEVAERMATTVAETLAAEGHDVTEQVIEYGATSNPGAVVTVRVDVRGAGGGDVDPVRPTAGVSALGERGKPSEDVAQDAIDRFLAFRDGPGAVDRHLADQLVVPVAVAGGEVAVPEVTDHLASSVELVGEFGLPIDCDERPNGGAVLRAPGSSL